MFNRLFSYRLPNNFTVRVSCVRYAYHIDSVRVVLFDMGYELLGILII